MGNFLCFSCRSGAGVSKWLQPEDRTIEIRNKEGLVSWMSEISEKTIRHRTDAKLYIEDYWTKRSPEFMKLRREELHSEKYALWQKELCSHFPPGKELKILDVGCGSGFFTILLGRQGHEVTGIDLTESMIADARALAAEEQCRVQLLVMDAENLQFPEETFDVVVSRNVTWNLPNPEQAYKEWMRVLKKGGILLNYDAEYGKYHHHEYEKEAVYSHKGVTPEMVEQCHRIYHMLDVSLWDRPQWDLDVLEKLGAASCKADRTVWERLYPQKDQFYMPVSLFGVCAIK